jgi:hypothetical protein
MIEDKKYLDDVGLALYDGNIKEVIASSNASTLAAAQEYIDSIIGSISDNLLQSDWDQTDETAIDFIKNKPDEEDALLLVAELGFVEPIADADGNVLTDENGAIYTL